MAKARVARHIGSAVVTLGLSLGAPHAAAVANADSRGPDASAGADTASPAAPPRPQADTGPTHRGAGGLPAVGGGETTGTSDVVVTAARSRGQAPGEEAAAAQQADPQPAASSRSGSAVVPRAMVSPRVAASQHAVSAAAVSTPTPAVPTAGPTRDFSVFRQQAASPAAATNTVTVAPARAAAPPAASLAAVAHPAGVASSLSPDAVARLTQVFDRIGHWLSNLPAGPLTDYVSGALLMVRRNLLPAAPESLHRSALSPINGTGPVLTGITSLPGSRSLVLSFNAPLIPGTATDLANYLVNASVCGNPELVTSNGPALKVVAAQYSATSSTSSQVALTLARPLRQGSFYRIFINGNLPITNGDPNSNPVTGSDGAPLDGDNDATAGGDFYGLFGVGKRFTFADFSGDRVTLAANGSCLNLWRELNGDIDQITVLPGADALTGSFSPGKEGSGTAYIGSVTIPVPTPLNLNGATNNLPGSFSVVPPGGLNTPPPIPTTTSPDPVTATTQNLPYTLSISPVSAPGITNLPGIQSAVYAQTAPTAAYPGGLWVVIGGRTNGLHNFVPSGEQSFPPAFQNGIVYVINPVDWQVWSRPWTQTDVPAAVYNSLSSTSQQYYQKGDTLYTVGGYSAPGTVSFTGDATAKSKTVTVTSGIENLAVGQSLSGVLPYPSGEKIFLSGTTITAINGNTVTASTAAQVDATGVSMAAFTREFKTYDTLTALSLKGLADAVINGGDVAKLSKVRQMSDPRLAVTGGAMAPLNGRTYLTFGHNFQGGYNGASASISQVYSDEIRSFRIIDTGRKLAIGGYQALRDPVNYRRRDGNLVNFIGSAGQPQLAYEGGVFSPGESGTGYRAPILIGPGGGVHIDAAYTQFFSQYTTANIPLFDPRSRSMYDILLAGISLYDDVDGVPTANTDLPWVDDVTSLVRARNGSFQEYMMPPIQPVTAGGTGYYGANAGYFQNPGLRTYRNGVIPLNLQHGPTVVGYMYGGIYSTVQSTGNNTFSQTGASNQVFQLALTPTGGA